jgi:hypothetical protein
MKYTENVLSYPGRSTFPLNFQVIKKNFGYLESGAKNIFDRRGVVRLDAAKANLDLDAAEEIAIECDAEVSKRCTSSATDGLLQLALCILLQDVDCIETEEGTFLDFYCNPTQPMQLRAALVERLNGDASSVVSAA